MNMKIEPATVAIRVVSSMADVDRAQWDACANPGWAGGQLQAPSCDPAVAAYNPFVSWDFLMALEESGSVAAKTGWAPRHLILEGEDGPAAVAPCYAKSHSQGEYVFDWGWADAFERAGGRYYPKLQVSVPFTPVTGPRLLTPPGPMAAARKKLLATGLVELCRRSSASSVHVTFLPEEDWSLLGEIGYLKRTDQQFHWTDQGYGDFEGFLEALASRKRKALRKERREALSPGITVEWLTGADITEAHWDSFFAFYNDTGARKWGRPYLNRRFFSMLSQRMAENVLLIMAKREGQWIAGALNLIGSDTLYGRYWGSIEDHPFLHFEVCYYQAIDFALSRGLKRVEAGAQGAHKLARGYLPQTTYSAHYIADPSFRRAVEAYLVQERREVEFTGEVLAERAPFRRGDPVDPSPVDLGTASWNAAADTPGGDQ
jgi:predicted N-acyltransferase